jgi:hypothetical protein
MPEVGFSQGRIHDVFFEGTDHELYVYRIGGKAPGKTLLIIGGIQGDEPGGSLSADHYADMSLARGNLIVVPRANFRSIVLFQRKVNEDMNRKFFDDPIKNYETGIVSILKRLIKESDCLLNLHDGSGFFSEQWESPDRNPKKFGQSIIADSEIHVVPESGIKLQLGKMARAVCRKINKNISNPEHHFHFNNHRTQAADTLHAEQRKSATYFALRECGIPAFGVETSKSLPLEAKVRQHNYAINGFMELLNIIPETPPVNLEPPLLDYIVISINDSLPVVVKNGQSLSISRGDRIMISHIEANYERGLRADIVNFGALNDIRKKAVITTFTRIVVSKDHFPCGSVTITVDGPEKLTGAVAVSDGRAADKSLLFFKLRVNGEAMICENYSKLRVKRGDKLEIVSVVSGFWDPSELVVNFKGYVSDPDNNTGEDRGSMIDTGRDLWERYSIDKAGGKYQVIVTCEKKRVGKLIVMIDTPALKYVVVNVGNDANDYCLGPEGVVTVPPGKLLRLVDIKTDISGSSGVTAVVSGPGDTIHHPIKINDRVDLFGILNPNLDIIEGLYRLDVMRGDVIIGSVYFKSTLKGTS